MGRLNRPPPKVIVTRSFSSTPGSLDELEQILFRWEMMLAQKALSRLQSENGGEKE